MLYTLLSWRECLNPEEIEKWKEAGKLARDALHYGKKLIQNNSKMIERTMAMRSRNREGRASRQRR